MARPKQEEELKRRNKITIRLSNSELGKVTGDAEKLGVTLSSYIRAKTLRGYLRIPKYAKVDKRLIGLLSKLGGLFKKTHVESGGVYHPYVPAVLQKIEAVLMAIQKHLENGETHRELEEMYEDIP